MKKNLTAIIFGLSIVVAAYLLGHAFMNRNKVDGTISVTGLGKADFTSDLIVWEGSFSKESLNLQQAYSDLEKDKKVISEYLLTKGITTKELVFNAVNSRNTTSGVALNRRGDGAWNRMTLPRGYWMDGTNDVPLFYSAASLA